MKNENENEFWEDMMENYREKTFSDVSTENFFCERVKHLWTSKTRVFIHLCANAWFHLLCLSFWLTRSLANSLSLSFSLHVCLCKYARFILLYVNLPCKFQFCWRLLSASWSLPCGGGAFNTNDLYMHISVRKTRVIFLFCRTESFKLRDEDQATTLQYSYIRALSIVECQKWKKIWDRKGDGNERGGVVLGWEREKMES